MKPKISGVNVTLEYANIESSLCKVAVTCWTLLSEKLYDGICNESATTDPLLSAKAKDYLQRAMLHFGVYEHLIYLITRIGNDGVTVKKNDDETTIYKYQQNELSNNLISTGWFWMNLLIQLLNDNKDMFPDWNPGTGDSVPIDGDDFNKWVGVNDVYFLVLVQWLIREVWKECVLSRQVDPEKNDFIARAVCYEVMGRACTRLAYMCLPEPVRRDMNDEMGKNHSAQADTYIRERVANIYLRKAESYWISWDVELKKEAVREGNKVQTDRPMFTPPKISENESFAY